MGHKMPGFWENFSTLERGALNCMIKVSLTLNRVTLPEFNDFAVLQKDLDE
jgi:hypothetical protein